jgi:hypothetical protein
MAGQHAAHIKNSHALEVGKGDGKHVDRISDLRDGVRAVYGGEWAGE